MKPANLGSGRPYGEAARLDARGSLHDHVLTPDTLYWLTSAPSAFGGGARWEMIRIVDALLGERSARP